MNMTRVRVRRERPTIAAWAMALVVTMLVVYVLTLSAAMPDVVESVSAAPRVTRRIEMEALKCWCVSMGRFDDPGQARIEAAGCVASGGAGLVYEIDGGWHVLGAMYSDERQAKRVAARVKAQGGAEAETICLEADSVTMRITAPDGQIDAIVAADDALRTQMRQLDGMASQLDRGELQPDGVRTLCALACTEVSKAKENLAIMPGASENGLCASLIDALGALSAQLDDIASSAQPANAALSGMMRLAQLDTFTRLRALQRSLLSRDHVRRGGDA